MKIVNFEENAYVNRAQGMSHVIYIFFGFSLAEVKLSQLLSMSNMRNWF